MDVHLRMGSLLKFQITLLQIELKHLTVRGGRLRYVKRSLYNSRTRLQK